MHTFVSAASKQARLPLPGQALTRRAITVITASIVALTFAFSLGNVTRLCLDLGITAWIAWLVAPAVDLSVVGLLTGIRFLSLHGYTDAQLARPRTMLRFCGILTLALNTAGALGHRQFGTALVDAVGPALLIGWSEAGPWLLRQIYAVCAPVPEQPEALPALVQPPVFPAALLAWARDLDAEHRAATGRPSPATPCASDCGSGATGPAPWSPPSAPRRPLPPGPGPGRCRRPRNRTLSVGKPASDV